MPSSETAAPVPAMRRAVANALGVTPPRRRDVLASMFEKPADDRALYWFELLLSMGIATFGLVLNSSGVVIGAMLIAPLMTPIVELAMALVVMSAYLLVQALFRVLVSVIVVLMGAAVITLVLPFNEATQEILARTSPTLLDLFVAIFCALAAAAVTVRPHSGATSTAAGTAIGISLVPPLCATGFGIGSASRDIAEGAFLLFTANFCAILVFAATFFWLVGFRPVKESTVEGRVAAGPLDASKIALARLIETRIGGRHGAYMRVLIPAVLLGVVIVPLAHALVEVSQEVRARAAVKRLVDSEPMLADALQVEQTVDRGALQLRAVVVGTDEEAADLERRLTVELAAATGSSPLVHVRAVPQAGLLARGAQATRAQTDPIQLISPHQAADKLAASVQASLDSHLPESAATVLTSRVELAASGDVAVWLALAERPLGNEAAAILARALSNDLGQATRVRSVGLPVDARTALARDHEAWLASVAEPLLTARSIPELSLCLTVPDDVQLNRMPAARRTRDTVLGWLAETPPQRIDLRTTDAWSLRVTKEGCAADAGLAGTAPARPATPPAS